MEIKVSQNKFFMHRKSIANTVTNTNKFSLFGHPLTYPRPAGHHKGLIQIWNCKTKEKMLIHKNNMMCPIMKLPS